MFNIDGSPAFLSTWFSLKLYFRLYVSANDKLSSSSQTFSFGEAGVFVAVRGIQGTSFATGSPIAFQIVASKLPRRQITCELRERKLLPTLVTPLSVTVFTNSSVDIQYIDVSCFLPRARPRCLTTLFN